MGPLEIRKLKPSKESLAEVSAFIEKKLNENAPRLFPNPYSKNETERDLGRWLKNWRSLKGTTWYIGLPEHQIQALEKQGLLIVRTQKKAKERMRELVTFIDKRLQKDSRVLLPSTYSKDEEEKSLGIWLNARKSRLKNKWHLGLPDHQIQALEKVGLLVMTN